MWEVAAAFAADCGGHALADFGVDRLGRESVTVYDADGKPFAQIENAVRRGRRRESE